MKKFLVSAAFVAAFSASQAFALDSTGCGLGSIIFKGQVGTIPQILAVTTNGSFGTQTFGISSGTSGCDQNGRVSGGTGKIFAFLEKNMEQFALTGTSRTRSAKSSKKTSRSFLTAMMFPPLR